MDRFKMSSLNPLNNPRNNLDCFGLIVVLILSLQSHAGPGVFDFGGSLKTIPTFQNLRQQGIYPYDDIPTLEERLRLQGALSFEKARLEFAHETFFFLQRANPPSVSIPDLNPRSAWNAQWRLLETNTTLLYHKLDRAFLDLDLDWIHLMIGKQVVPLGVGHIFNAVSQIQRYPLIFIDPEFPKSEDAVTLIWDGPPQIEARFLPKTSGQRQDSFHFLMKGTTQEADWSLISGVSDDKTFLGLNSAFNLGESLMRFEEVNYFSRDKYFVQALLGFDQVFSPVLSSKIELFYNGFGATKQTSFTGLTHRSAPFQGKWYFGNITEWEIHPLLKSHFVSILNLEDPSALFHFFLNYSISNSVDLLIGQFFGLGSGTAEFGGQKALGPIFGIGQPDISYAALRWYF